MMIMKISITDCDERIYAEKSKATLRTARGESSGFSKNIGCFAQFSFLSLRAPGVVVAAAGSLVHFWFQSEINRLLENVPLLAISLSKYYVTFFVDSLKSAHIILVPQSKNDKINDNMFSVN